MDRVKVKIEQHQIIDDNDDKMFFDGEAILVPGEGGIGNIFHYINGKFDFHQRVYKISDFADEVCGKFIYFYMSR